MIYDSGCKTRAKKDGRPTQSLVKTTIDSKSFEILSQEELNRFLSDHEIIHCAQLLQDRLSCEKLLRVYFLLFQVCASYGHKEAIFNFLKRYEFTKKLNQACPSNWSKSQIIISTKISKFLDSFKEILCPKHQLNSLISEYHQFRLLQNMKQTFIVSALQVIKSYILFTLNFLLTELQFTTWNEMNQQNFNKFYKSYCQICTICKRVSYIKCTLFILPVFQIPQSIRNSIQSKNNQIRQGKTQIAPKSPLIMKQQAKTQKQTMPFISVKKKLKAMNSLINKMEQKM